MARLPILMYHNVSEAKTNSHGLTISKELLERHFQYLSENNFTTFHLGELEGLNKIPQKSIVITFDDVTVNQQMAVELLQKYNLKATFFIPFAYVGKTDEWNQGKEPIMTYDQLRNLPENIELGLHSYSHPKYSDLSEAEIVNDFQKCFEVIEGNGLNVHYSLAYPYGNYPKKEPLKSQFQKLLIQNGIKMGLRIGNGINVFPFKNPYEIKRIDIKGEDNLLRFRIKLRFGKLKLF
ncbi:polysaccharide deacetylase family protein [Flavobacterium sp.]|uniref:polysaccharide deacetylase family protein n=1 Tax=Flavobacterium sp. TaxID=239 RepID=UPI0028BF304E|nr:polysaccharide deacetylase family protein [Flavobacterium sp.]